MPKPIRKPNPARDLAEQLRQRILTGEIRPGDRLLPERRLAAELGHGLHHVRSALRQLRDEGLLVARRRSGVQVAAPVPPLRGNATSPTGENDEGFHLFDILSRPQCHLRFLVSAWSPPNRSTWETICRNYSLAHPDAVVEPFFPASPSQYNALRHTADLCIVNPSLFGHPRELRGIHLLAADVLEGTALPETYRQAVRTGARGFILGVPFAGTLLTGMINQATCPPALQARLAGADSFPSAFAHLLAPNVLPAGVSPLNFFATQTLNLFQLSHLVCGGLFEKRGEAHMRFNLTMARRVLELAAAIRAGQPAPTDPTAFRHPECCALFLQYTYALVPHLHKRHLQPWPFPLATGGHTIEGINVGAVRQDSPYPEQATTFLLHLLSADVQQRLARLPGEHPLSSRIAQPFQSYPDHWRRVLAAQRERAWVMTDLFPGYMEYLHGVLFPLALRFFDGRIDGAMMATELERRARRFLRGA